MKRKNKKLNGFQTKQRNQQRNQNMRTITINCPVETRLIDEEYVEFNIGKPMFMGTKYPLKNLPSTIVYTFSDEYLNKIKMVRYDEDIKNITWGIVNPKPYGEYFDSLHSMMKHTFNSFINNKMIVDEFLIKYGVMCREMGYMSQQLELLCLEPMTSEDKKRRIKNIPIIEKGLFIGKNEVELSLEELDMKYGTNYNSMSSSKWDEIYDQKNPYHTNDVGVS